MRLKIISFLLLVSSSAMAVNYAGPVGHREAFLANSGGAMIDSPGNVLLNPAGLGFRQNKETALSVSGNAVARQEFNVSQYSVDPEEMTVRPLLAASVFPTQYGTMAVFLANPTAFRIYGGSEYTTSGVAVKTLLRIDYQELATGVTFANTVNSDLAWGVSAGVSIETQKSYGYTRAFQTGVTAATSFNLTEQKTVSLFVTPGLLYKATDFWHIGLSMKTLADISSTANTQRFATSSSSPTTVEETDKSFDPNGTNPFAYRLGQEFIFSPANSLYFDVVYVSATSAYNSNNEKYLNDEVWEGSLGYRHGFSGSYELLTGYAYTQSQNADFNMFSAGLSMNRRNNEFIVGVYYLSNTPKDAASSGFNSYGVLFSSNVEY
nr:hypothetical protein [uncultured Bdellovibrio sp.]